MGDVYVDFDKTPSTEDGTDWANAYISFTTVSASEGDDVWVKGTESVASTSTLTTMNGVRDNPVRLFGVKAATTNEPPVASDLIPGWRTGETRTEANRAYNDAGAPSLTVTGANDIDIQDHLYFYAINFIAGKDFDLGGQNCGAIFEECSITWGANGTAARFYLRSALGAKQATHRMINGEIKTTNAGDGFSGSGGQLEMVGVLLTSAATLTPGLFGGPAAWEGNVECYGCDFSDRAHTIQSANGRHYASRFIVANTQIHASASLVSGSVNNDMRFEFHGVNSTTAKSSGSLQNVDIILSEGTITEETTAVRTGGASDGEAGDHSMAMTPNINGTRDQYRSLVGPWMAFWVTNADTAVDVFIANSGAADYNDDDAWLEVMDVSEGGTAQHTHLTTQMDLLATPVAVADDAVSTWGTGGNNPQKLSATISPDFSGWAYCRVHFAKNFGASPETLYVDPNPVTS